MPRSQTGAAQFPGKTPGFPLARAQKFLFDLEAQPPGILLGRIDALAKEEDDETYGFVLAGIAHAFQALVLQASKAQGWGNTFEDQLASSIARIPLESPDPQRVEVVRMLWGHAILTRYFARGFPGQGPPQQPAVFGCMRCGFIGAILCGSGTHPPLATVVPIHGVTCCVACGVAFAVASCGCGAGLQSVPLPKAPAPTASPDAANGPAMVKAIDRLNALQQPQLAAAAAILPGNPGPDLLPQAEAQMREFAKEYEAMLAMPIAPEWAWFGDIVRARLDDANAWIARAVEARGGKARDTPENRLHDGAIDDEIARRLAVAASLPKSPIDTSDINVLLAHAKAFVELGEAYGYGGDEPNAEAWFRKAKPLLEQAEGVVHAEGVRVFDFSRGDRPLSAAEFDFLLSDKVRNDLFRAGMVARDLQMIIRIRRRCFDVIEDPEAWTSTGTSTTAVLDQIHGRLTGLRRERRRHRTAGTSMEDLLPEAQSLRKEARALNIADVSAAVAGAYADILVSMGQGKEALKQLRAARDSLGDRRRQNLQPDLLEGMAAAHASLGDWAATSKACDEGIRLIESFRWRANATYVQTSYLRSSVRLYALGVEAAFREDDAATMVARADLAKSQAQVRSWRRDAPINEATDRLLAEFKDACGEVDKAQRAPGPVPEDLLLLRGGLWDRLVIQRAKGVTKGAAPHIDLKQIQKVLQPDEAVLDYFWTGPLRLVVAAIDRRQAVLSAVDITVDERAALQAFADYAFGSGGQRVDPAGLKDAFGRLPGTLVPAEAGAVLEGKRRLVLSPHRILHGIPLHALPWNGLPLGESFAVSYAPNLASLLLDLGTARPPRLLAVGLSEFDAALAKRHGLKPLPGIVGEVKAVLAECKRRGMNADAPEQSKCTDEWFRAQDAAGFLAAYTNIHLATHGSSVASDTPMESHVYLRNALLDGLDIATTHLQADLVVLSACSAGQRALRGRGLEELPGDDLLGLPAAFFAAGARQILCPLWPVDDEAAAAITSRFQALVLAGRPADLALQESVKEFRAGARLLHRGPYFWAPFILLRVGPSDADGG